MNFEEICVTIVIILAIGCVTFLMDVITNGDDYRSMIMAWIISTIGFGVCLTELLIQKGVI